MSPVEVAEAAKDVRILAPTLYRSIVNEARKEKPMGTPPPVTTLEELDDYMNKMVEAQRQYALFTQEQVDHIFQCVALELGMIRLELAQYAFQDTKRGCVEDKMIKNHFAAEYIYNKYKSEKTVGTLEYDEQGGFSKISTPVGPIAGVIPITNPTSTVIFKVLMALKTGNAIMLSPSPNATLCVAFTAEICRRQAVAAGAPEYLIGCIDGRNMDLCKAILVHPKIRFLLATGGPRVVRACAQSGKPSIGVGAGNCPALVDETCDINEAVGSITLSKTFDNGMICASESTVVVVESVFAAFKAAMIKRGVDFLNPEDTDKVGRTVITKEGYVNLEVMGMPATFIAKLAGVEVAPETIVLAGMGREISDSDPMSFEKLCPVLGIYVAKDFNDGVDKAEALVRHGGLGHSAALYTNLANRSRIEFFQHRMPAFRIMVDMPSAQGAIGDIYNFRLEPAMTLGCGALGSNSTSENLSVRHLINVKNVAERRENMLMFKVPPAIYFNRGILHEALKDLTTGSAKITRVTIITCTYFVESGMISILENALLSYSQIHAVSVFDQVEPDPTFKCVMDGVHFCNEQRPDSIIAFGGGSPIDAAKVIRLLYEHPEANCMHLCARFMDIRKRLISFPNHGSKVKTLVCIPTTSGTGAEITPFAVLTGDDGRKYPIASYRLTPQVAIIDSTFCMGMPSNLTAWTGIDALVHALESYVSVLSSDYTRCLSLQAAKMIQENIVIAYRDGKCIAAREQMHNGAAIAGMAFANAFLGVCHSMAHQLGSKFHIPHGLANALVMSHVIDYNATDHPTRMATFPHYKYPIATRQYAEIADALGLCKCPVTVVLGDDDKVTLLIEAIERMKKDLDIPLRIKDYKTFKGLFLSEELFLSMINEMSQMAFDDQCTGANPRWPLISEIETLYRRAWYGPPVRPAIAGLSISVAGNVDAIKNF